MPRYADDGAGPLVVLLHSGVCDHRMWDPQVEALAGTYRVVRPDLRGFGETPMPPGEFSYAEDVAALLDHLDAGPAVLVGSSFGGNVALEVAAARPDRVTALVLLCAAYAGMEPGPDVVAFGEKEERLLEAGDVEGAVELNVVTWLGPDATPHWRERVRRMQRRAFEVQLAADEIEPPPRPTSVPVELRELTAPTLVVSGGLDLAHFHHVARHLAESMPAARHLHLPWAGHLPSMERPGAVVDLLSDFLVTHASE